jgi:hypothetical protein
VACHEGLQDFASPEFPEALALLRVVILAHEEGIDRVLFAFDCLSLVQRINSLSMDMSFVGILVAQIKQFSEFLLVGVFLPCEP